MDERLCGPLAWATVDPDAGTKASLLALDWSIEAHVRWRPNAKAIANMRDRVEMLTCDADRLEQMMSEGRPLDDWFAIRKPLVSSSQRLWAAWDLRQWAREVSNQPLWARKSLVDPARWHPTTLPNMGRSLLRAEPYATQLLPERDIPSEICELAGLHVTGEVAAMVCSLDETFDGDLEMLVAAARAVLE